MLGSVLAGASESEAKLVEHEGHAVKVSTGFVTFGMRLMLKRAYGEPVTPEELAGYTPEGVEATFEFSGPVAGTLRRLIGGLRSGMSYSGASCLADLREKVQFIRVSAQAMVENTPHVQDRIPQMALDYASEALG